MKTKFTLFIVATMVYSFSSFAAQDVKKYAISQDAMLDRFMEYIAIESGSDEEFPEGMYPMTEGQKQMAEKLAADARALGAKVTLSEWGYVYVRVPSNIKKKVPSIGFSCHLDYTPEVNGKGIKPTVIKSYRGGVIQQEHGVIDPATPFGEDLPKLIGKTIIHADGTTLLGGDDKNGCAIVMSVIESVIKKGYKHGELQFAFCPNEDIGGAAWKIDSKYFNPDIVVDVDMDGGHKVSVANFIASRIDLRFVGQDAHPSFAKAQHLGDAVAAAATFVSRVPLQYRPENTEGEQGYIHPWGWKCMTCVEGDDEEAKEKRKKLLEEYGGPTYEVSTRIRYFDKEEGKTFNRIIRDNISYVQRAFPYVKTIILNEEVQYDNVAYTMHPQSLPLVEKAAARCGIKLEYEATRAGTTAAMFAAKGLRGGICLFSGQHNEHSLQEFSVLEEMYDSYMLLLTMIDEVMSIQ